LAGAFFLATFLAAGFAALAAIFMVTKFPPALLTSH
jgi:hypothetical protein